MNTRICRLCSLEQDLSQFRKSGKYYRTECHKCELKQISEYRNLPSYKKRHAELEKERRKRPEQKTQQQAYFKELRSRPDFKEKVRNDPRRKASHAKWLAKPESRELLAKWYRKKRKEDIRYRLSNVFSRSVRRGLKSGKGGISWKEMVGYNVDQLKSHLESLFYAGMTWDNYGEWHIDHIRPVTSFHFSTHLDPEFKECWALSNLQPLWAIDNIRKGSR